MPSFQWFPFICLKTAYSREYVVKKADDTLQFLPTYIEQSNSLVFKRWWQQKETSGLYFNVSSVSKSIYTCTEYCILINFDILELSSIHVRCQQQVTAPLVLHDLTQNVLDHYSYYTAFRIFACLALKCSRCSRKFCFCSICVGHSWPLWDVERKSFVIVNILFESLWVKGKCFWYLHKLSYMLHNAVHVQCHMLSGIEFSKATNKLLRLWLKLGYLLCG